MENIYFRIVGLKEPDYTMLIICAYESLARLTGTHDNTRVADNSRTTFKYSETLEISFSTEIQ